MNARPGLWELALTFNHIALASFGGGLSAWAREILVVRKQWMTEMEFLSAVTMCRILPGANQVNLAIFTGAKFGGPMGAVAAVTGLTAVPATLALGLAWGYFQFHEVPELQSALRGATAAAIALTLSMAIKTGRKALTGMMPVLLFSLIFAGNGILRLPLLACLAVLAPVGVLWAWPRGEKRG